MPRGRRPEGETTLSNAERQARYRARHKSDHPTPVLRVRYRRPADRRSRPQRWNDAVAELLALQAEFIAWLDALPDGFRDTATAEALQAIADLDLTELQTIIPPRGFGRDR
jgi:lysophospholipase L1-like esterase